MRYQRGSGGIAILRRLRRSVGGGLRAADIRGLADTVATTTTVLSPAQALDITITLVDALSGTGRVNKGVLNSLDAKCDALVRSRGLTELQVAPIRTLLNRVIRSLSIS